MEKTTVTPRNQWAHGGCGLTGRLASCLPHGFGSVGRAIKKPAKISTGRGTPEAPSPAATPPMCFGPEDQVS